VRGDGLRLLNQHRYGEAINQFWTAYTTCDDKPANHDLDRLIQRAQNEWVKTLNAARDSADAARQRAEIAQAQANELRHKAEQSEQQARVQGRRAEALRLTLVADNARLKGRSSDAVLLSYLSILLAGDDVAPAMWRAFADAVRDSLSVRIATPAGAEQVVWAGTQGAWIGRFADGSVWYATADQPQTPRLLGAATPEAVTRLEVAPDGKTALRWWPEADSVQVFDLTTRRRARTLNTHSDAVRAVHFSPDGQRFLTCSRDNTAQIQTVSGGAPVQLVGHTGNVYDACFLKNGNVVTRSSDGTARLWDAQGKLISTLNGRGGYVYALAAKADGSRFATGNADGTAEIWTDWGGEFARLDVGSAPVRHLWFGLDAENGETWLAAATGKDGLVVGRSADDDMSVRSILSHHANQPQVLAVAEGGREWITTADDLKLYRWQAKQSRAVEVVSGHHSTVLAARFAPDRSGFLLSVSAGSARLWAPQGEFTCEWPDAGTASFSPDGTRILTSDPETKRVVVTPRFDLIFKQLQQKEALLSIPEMQRLRQQYEVQFVEDLKM
jgi:WD40 repeat protein